MSSYSFKGQLQTRFLRAPFKSLIVFVWGNQMFHHAPVKKTKSAMSVK